MVVTGFDWEEQGWLEIFLEEADRRQLDLQQMRPRQFAAAAEEVLVELGERHNDGAEGLRVELKEEAEAAKLAGRQGLTRIIMEWLGAEPPTRSRSSRRSPFKTMSRSPGSRTSGSLPWSVIESPQRQQQGAPWQKQGRPDPPRVGAPAYTPQESSSSGRGGERKHLYDLIGDRKAGAGEPQDEFRGLAWAWEATASEIAALVRS